MVTDNLRDRDIRNRHNIRDREPCDRIQIADERQEDKYETVHVSRRRSCSARGTRRYQHQGPKGEGGVSDPQKDVSEGLEANVYAVIRI